MTGPAGPVPTIGVRLVPQSVTDATDERAFDAASTISDPSGAFTFLGVPAGAYVLKIGRVPAGQGGGCAHADDRRGGRRQHGVFCPSN